MPEGVYVTAEDDKLHLIGGGEALLLCGKVMVRPANEHEIATREMCEDCERALSGRVPMNVEVADRRHPAEAKLLAGGPDFRTELLGLFP